MFDHVINKQSSKGLQQMIKGLKRFIAENSETLNDKSPSLMLLLAMEKKLKKNNEQIRQDQKIKN